MIVEAKLIQKAIITKDDPRSIVNDILGKASKNAISKMSRPAALAQRIRRIRRNRNSFKSKKIDDLVSIDIPESLRFTKRNAWFYYDDKERILVFTTERNLQYLNKNLDWFVDGTFDVAPSLFTQLFTIQANVNGKVLPLIYSLIPNKKESSYVKLFKMVKHYSKEPNTINCDFEELF